MNTYKAFLGAVIFTFSITYFAQIANASPIDNININRIKAADKNHDGNITKNEIINYKASQFSKLDRNNDNYISMNDMPKFGAKHDAKDAIKELIKMNDMNNDNRLSYLEYINGRLYAIEIMDKNKDGMIDSQEFNYAKQLQSRQ